MKKTKINKKEEAYYWPLWFCKSLSISEQAKAKKIIKKIQIAQYYLWHAFNIYDDFLDGDSKSIELLTANNYFQKYLKIHYQLKLSSDYYKLFEITFDKLNVANKKEMTRKKLAVNNGQIIIPKRIPKKTALSALADKSLILALGPIAILSYLGYKVKNKRIQMTLIFFQHVLAAKQLCDDSRDWLDDLKNGLATNVNIQIIRTAKKTKTSLNLNVNLAAIHLLFAAHVAPKIIRDLKTLCRKAEQTINKEFSNTNTTVLRKLTKPILSACQKADKFRHLVLEN